MAHNVERLQTHLKNTEKVILELLLMCYPLLIIAEDAKIPAHYLTIGLAIVLPMIASYWFYTKTFSIGSVGIFSAAFALIMYMNHLPVVLAVMIFVYTFWRIYENFSDRTKYHWNFLAVHLAVFTAFYFITRSFMLKPKAAEVLPTMMYLFLFFTLLYIVLRYSIILMMTRYQEGVGMVETNRIFLLITGASVATFLTVFFLIETVRTVVIGAFTFLFGGILMGILKIITPLYDYIVDYLDYLRYRAYKEMEPPEITFVEFEMHEERSFLTNASVNFGPIASLLFIIIMIVVFIWYVKSRGRQQNTEETKIAKVKSLGRKKSELKKKKWLYSEPTVSDQIRTAYQQFEKDAKTADYTRFSSETVKEWFERMKWQADGVVFEVYEKARYGSNAITDEERHHFLNILEKIKENNFKK